MLDSLPDIARRAVSNPSHSALSGKDGMVTVSPYDRPVSFFKRPASAVSRLWLRATKIKS